MNPETTLSSGQIIELFAQNNLKVGSHPSTNRLKIGFTNEVHELNQYILKVYVRPEWEEYFEKEARLYKTLYGKVLVPKVVVADGSKSMLEKPYIIYERINGEPLSGRWHKLTNNQRRAIIGTLCGQLKLIRASEPNPQLTPKGSSWQDKMYAEIENRLKTAATKGILTSEVIQAIHNFVNRFKDVLKLETLGLMYWDVHLDNIIVNDKAEVVGLIDFEHVDVVSIDFVLILVRNMMAYPYIMLSASKEKHADKGDYKYLMDWYREFYPDLFAFENLERRIDFYDLADVLRMLPRFPHAKQLHERINRILSNK